MLTLISKFHTGVLEMKSFEHVKVLLKTMQPDKCASVFSESPILALQAVMG